MASCSSSSTPGPSGMQKKTKADSFTIIKSPIESATLSDSDDQGLESDENYDFLGGTGQVFGSDFTPPAPKKARTENIDHDVSIVAEVNKPARRSFVPPTPRVSRTRAPVRRYNQQVINLSENESSGPLYFLGKNVYIESNMFKGVRYVGLIRKDGNTITNRFNFPLNIFKNVQKAVDIFKTLNN